MISLVSVKLVILNLGLSGKLSFIIYKFWQNCASVRQVSDLVLKTENDTQSGKKY